MTIKFINGKFTAQRLTGVQRAASCLVSVIDQSIRQERSGDGNDWVLLCPRNGIVPALANIRVQRIGSAGLSLHIWEQLLLPFAARAGSLTSLAGSAPLLAYDHRVLMHDAAVFDWPGAYARTFVCWYRFLFRSLARSGAALLTVSQFSRERLTSALGVEKERIAVIPLGSDHLDDVVADSSITARLGLEEMRYLLAVASDNPTKNISALVAAFARLGHDEKLRLVIVGGKNGRVFRATCSSEATAGVIHAGPVSDPELKALYSRATALVFPSLYEGFGLPPLEAMACGCPVVAAREASVPEVCGNAALYFDPRSQDSIVAALQAVLGDSNLRERLRKAGRERTASFRWIDSARSLLAQLDRKGLA